MGLDLEQLTLEQFERCVGDSFALSARTHDGAPRELALVLESATAGTGPPPRDGSRRAFALSFSGPLDAPLPQGVTPLRHAELGELPIFLVPVGRDAGGYRYEAIFG